MAVVRWHGGGNSRLWDGPQGPSSKATAGPDRKHVLPSSSWDKSLAVSKGQGAQMHHWTGWLMAHLKQYEPNLNPNPNPKL